MLFQTIICDEATRLSNPRTKTYKAIIKLRSERRIALTGTPIQNKATDIYGIINWTNPGVLGNYYSFIDRYCLKNHFGGIFAYQNMDELKNRLQRYMIRRTKEEVLPELPKKIIIDVPFKLNDEEKKLYTKIKKELLFEIEKMDISKINNPATIQYTLVKMTRLRMLADSMELLGEKQISSKLDVLKELLIEIGRASCRERV